MDANAMKNLILIACLAILAAGCATQPSHKMGAEVGTYPTATTPLGGSERILCDQALVTSNCLPSQISSYTIAQEFGSNLACSTTMPTVSSGGGTSPSIAGTNTCSFQLTEGSGTPSTTLVLTLPTATTGWICQANDVTNSSTVGKGTQSAVSTTSASITWGTAPSASDKVLATCRGF